MATKVTMDMQEFLDSVGFLYRLNQIPITKFDFSCIFEKDISYKHKVELKKRFGDDIKKVITCFLAVKGFSKEVKAKIRKDIKITHNYKRGTWGFVAGHSFE